jgi:hypothetical protein
MPPVLFIDVRYYPLDKLFLDLAIPVKVGSDSDLNPVGGSEVKPGVFGAQRRWRSYGA